MNNKGEPFAGPADDVMDDDTVELLALDPATFAGAAGVASAARAADPADVDHIAEEAAEGPQSQAFLWLKHMESELDRLQSRWGRIDTELAERDARIESLLAELGTQETSFVELRTALATREADVAAREQELESLRAALAARDAELAAKDRELGAGARTLAETEKRGRETDERLHAARARIDDLELGAQRARAEHEELSQRVARLTQTNEALLGKIQDLELYIEGRKNDWTERAAELARYRARLAELERAVRDKDKEGARREKDKEKLNDKILELERRCSELIGRRRERDDAYQELEERLALQIKQAEQLRADLERGELTAHNALDEAARSNRVLEALRLEVEQRDAKLAELAEQNETLAAAAAEAQLREQALARAREEIAGLRQEREDLTRSLGDARRELTALESAAESTAERARALEAELEAQRANVRGLERELEERRRTMNLLDKNLHRINVLGTSLQRIDRNRDGRPELVPPATLTHTHADGNVHYLGTADAVRAGKRMLVGIGGDDNLLFPLHKQNMTIGRSHKSDIRINGQFVSRIHARVLNHPSGTVIEDLGSKNGILVNTQPVTRCVLKDGDIVSLGGKLDLKYVERET